MRKFESIRWRLTLSYAAIALLAAFSLGLVLRTILRNYYDRQEATYLQSRAIEISSIASQLLEAELPEQVIQDLSKSWSFVLRARVRLLDAAGNQVADSGTPEGQQVFFIASERPFPDRKSTRLNSSHVEISYAVFCLKKKKKKNIKNIIITGQQSEQSWLGTGSMISVVRQKTQRYGSLVRSLAQDQLTHPLHKLK